jgi:hypothetical protein
VNLLIWICGWLDIYYCYIKRNQLFFVQSDDDDEEMRAHRSAEPGPMLLSADERVKDGRNKEALLKNLI